MWIMSFNFDVYERIKVLNPHLRDKITEAKRV